MPRAVIDASVADSLGQHYARTSVPGNLLTSMCICGQILKAELRILERRISSMTHIARKVLVVLSSVFAGASARTVSQVPPQVVTSVDLGRYVGKWYEIAHLPAWFQRDCASDTTATYTLRPDGKVTVLNECRKQDGVVKSAKGVAHIASREGPNTKLKVTFFWPFFGDYWIIDLDSQYRWAVIGEPNRKYFWILSREPHLDPAIYTQIIDRASKQGYDLAPLQITRHSR
jgi:apolipoprotein D and lipocalin family protein